MQDLFAKFHLFEISALATAVTCFGLAALIFTYRNSTLHTIWTLHNLAIGAWSSFVFLASLTDSPDKAYHFWIISHFFGSYIALWTFHPTCLFCNLNYSGLLRIAYFYTVLFSLMHFILSKALYTHTKFLFGSIHYMQVRPMEFYMSLSIWFFLSIFSIFLLLKYAAENKTPKGSQAKLFGIVSILGYTGGCSSFLPMSGINFYPITMFLLPVYAIAQTYAVFKHQLFGLRVILEKSLIYSTLITLISILYLSIVIILEKAMRDFIGYNSLFVALSFGLIISIFFIPLRNKIQHYADRWLFKATPLELAAENQLLRQNAVQSEKMKTVATLASSIAHEIRNPLTSLKTFVEYFPHKKHDPQFQEKFHAIVTSEVNRIEEILSQLLEFSKPSPLNLKETRVAHVIENALTLTSNSLKQNNIAVVKDFAPSLPTLKADPNKLLQVFLNLILNAQDAMPKGGTLTITTKSIGPGRDTNYEIRDTNSIKILLSDTGTGISQEHLKKIFDPFFSTKEKGTGLGLSICQSIIEDHSGKITAESQINAGTTFKIVLPEARSEGTPA